MKRCFIILLLLAVTFMTKANGIYSDRQHDGSMTIAGHGGALSLELGLGQLMYYPNNVKSLFIADPSIANFKVKSPGVIYLLPKALGQTNLIGVDRQDKIIINKTIIVRLNLPVLQDLIRKMAPRSHVKIETARNIVVLRGTVAYPEDSHRIMRMLTSYLRNVKILNFMRVTRPAQVYLRVRIVELSRSVTKALGLNWNLAYSGGDVSVSTGFPSAVALLARGLAGAGVSSFTGGAGAALLGATTGDFNFQAFLNFLESHGLATILAEPNLTTLSGTEASFRAGGQFPIPVSQALGATTVQFVNFGVSLNFTPDVIQNGLIDLRIGVEVSSLSGRGAVRENGFSIPGLTDRSAHVQVDLHSGQSFAIAGLLQKNMSKTVRKYPGLGDIPILGKLFRSEQFLKNESELVIIVTPYLVRPVKRSLLGDPLHLPPPQFTQWK